MPPVSRSGAARVLIAGGSGSGKTTLALALVRQGFGFLADDMVFLVPMGPGVRVLPFPEELDVSASTVALFPGIWELLSCERLPGASKRQLDVRRLGAEPTLKPTSPALLLFPEVSGDQKSTFEQIGEDEALHELVPNVLLTERSSTQAHLDALAALAASAPAWRVKSGTDIETLPDRISTLLGHLAGWLVVRRNR